MRMVRTLVAVAVALSLAGCGKSEDAEMIMKAGQWKVGIETVMNGQKMSLPSMNVCFRESKPVVDQTSADTLNLGDCKMSDVKQGDGRASYTVECAQATMKSNIVIERIGDDQFMMTMKGRAGKVDLATSSLYEYVDEKCDIGALGGPKDD